MCVCGRIPETRGGEATALLETVACRGILSWTLTSLRRVQTNFFLPACCSVANWTPTCSSFAHPGSQLLQLRRRGPSHHRHRHYLFLGRSCGLLRLSLCPIDSAPPDSPHTLSTFPSSYRISSSLPTYGLHGCRLTFESFFFHSALLPRTTGYLSFCTVGREPSKPTH